MFQPNSVIAGRYQVIRLVGQGGMSNLYLAYDRKYNNAIVVVKEMTAAYSDPKEQQMAVELFHREAKLLASLNHRHIPKVYDYFQFAGKYYLSMEFIDGEDLAQKLEATKGPLPENQVLEWGEQIATVLFYLHKHEPPIVFRDVKPSNIMLCEQGVKLIDFGIARHFDQAKKGDTMRIGSPGYAPPEQYAAQTDPRSDIYALGVTLHHALTGRDPTATQTPFLVPPARNLNPALSEATAAMLARATQLDPSDRYQNILEMKNDIKHILSRGKQSTRVVGAPPPPPGPAVVAPPAAAVAVALSSSAQPPATVGTAPASPTSAAAAVPVAATTTPTPAAAGASSLTAAPAPGKPAKKRRGKSLALVALVLLLAGGGFAAAGPEGRQKLVSASREFLASLSQGSSSASPEDQVRTVIQTGDPRGLLPMFGNGAVSGLSPNKQELYRLNLLAAETASDNAPPGIIHLLYPEGTQSEREEDMFSAAAQAVAAINAEGGLDKHLLVVLPRTFAPGRLNSVIAKLSEQEAKGGQRFLLFIDKAEVAELSEESKAQRPLVLADTDPGEAAMWLPTLASGKAAATLFANALEAKVLWAAGEAPTGSKAEAVEFSDVESLNSLLKRSADEEIPVVVEAARVSGLQGLSQEGRLLLLAIGVSELPSLPPGCKAEALVLGSPLRQNSSLSSSLTLSPTVSFSATQARLFDSVLLTALHGDQGYSGITLTRTPKETDKPGIIVRYRWTAEGWVPSLEGQMRKP